MNPLDEVLTAGEAADHLKVTRRQITRLCQSNKLIFREASGGYFLILKSSVIEYEEHRKKREN
ncbi:excisionase family DNA binding protein [Paenibacillus phyllosphaerae]|uniref:Excisionase family DNA binding protein n=1 Tax=Paenibacillus phyllosphaerae TaxID=274593 RepID=A0A7W5B397_9BACL|nr:helix-turn-helix domain-containing protein [Paenibacillus phyllosphaerae]MBB3113614.1 excisionase family DNA binding protein [Paenibacillus phyllosphaerae]